MINILKPFGALATSVKRNEFSRATFKLTFYYVLSTAAILLVSSVAVLAIFAPPETELPFKTEVPEQIEVEHDDWSLDEVREHLATVIIIVDTFILLLVSVFAYFFARRTLLPIQVMHERQRQFMGDVAHELRTPLSVMQAGAETILRRDRTTAEYKMFVVDAQEEAVRLTRVSNQLLQLLNAGEVKTAPRAEVSVSELLATEVRRFTPYAAARGVSLTSDIARAVATYTHADDLIEIVQNLLKNGIDYSNKGDRVSLSLRATASAIDIVVTDTGVGIDPAEQEAIFYRFKKLDKARTQTKDSGTGLGLAIVRALVDGLGGRITLKSEVGVGTELTVSLPKYHS